MKLADLIAKTQAYEDKLRTPREFFAERSAHYVVIGRNIVRATMIAMRPPDRDPESWNRHVQELADAVTAHLVTAGTGLRITLEKPADGSLPSKVSDRSPVQSVGFDDVMQWIRDGLEGKPGGKQLTAEDEADLQSEEALRNRASIIMKAYYGLDHTPAWESLRHHIQRWLRSEDQLEPDHYLTSIRKAWAETFGPILRDDLARWARTQW